MLRAREAPVRRCCCFIVRVAVLPRLVVRVAVRRGRSAKPNPTRTPRQTSYATRTRRAAISMRWLVIRRPLGIRTLEDLILSRLPTLRS